MRTTLTVDDHLMRELKALAHGSGQPLKKVINDTLRSGLECGRNRRPSKPYRCKTSKMGYPPRLNLDKALEIAAALEDDETGRKLALKKMKRIDLNLLIYAVNTDAHLAALAIEHGATLYSTDNDFHASMELRWKNPIAS